MNYLDLLNDNLLAYISNSDNIDTIFKYNKNL